mgnify:CR=1 FL=1
MAGNTSLGRAKDAKNDEFYTQLSDIEKELRHYRRHFRGKTVFCNCDDPFESNFFKYFVLNFNRLGLKKLIATCYTGSPIAGQQLSLFDVCEEEEEDAVKPYKAVVTKVYDTTGDGGVDMLDVAELFRSGENELTELRGDGDFRSEECLALLEEADIVVTNPPFSLFREYVATLMEYEKQFVIIGSVNAITYKEIFPLLMENKIWLGYGFSAGNAYFKVSPDRADDFADGVYNYETGLVKFRNCHWFTNLDIKKRHEKMILVKRYNAVDNPQYDNYDAIEVGKLADIPCDYAGVMGVPITFMDKYNPEQFEIVGITKTWFGAASKIYGIQIQIDRNGKRSNVSKLNDGPSLKVSPPPKNKTYYEVDGETYIQTYARILIRNKHPEAPKEG